MTNIVMICRGRYRLLRQALESLRGHTRIGDYNVVFVHDEFCDDFRVGRVLREFAAANTNARVLTDSSGDHVLARLKNIGVEWSRQCWGEGDWLHVGDSDVWFSPHWLENLTRVAEMTESKGFRLWGGQIHPFHKAIEASVEWTEHQVLDGPSWLMRWSTWRIREGLQRTCAAGACQSEEIPFCRELRVEGWRIGVIYPHVVVHTGLTQTDGKDAPGRTEREKMIPQGVVAE